MIMHKKGGKAYARDGCRFSFVYLRLDFTTYPIFSLTPFKHTREWNAEIHAHYESNVLCLDFIALVWDLCCNRHSVHKIRHTALELFRYRCDYALIKPKRILCVQVRYILHIEMMICFDRYVFALMMMIMTNSSI